MRALIMMLKNTMTGKFHPIWYREYPLPGERNSIIRYKSAGHHTNGFESLEEANTHVAELKTRLEDQGYNVSVETDKMVDWTGRGTPADIQLRREE